MIEAMSSVDSVMVSIIRAEHERASSKELDIVFIKCLPRHNSTEEREILVNKVLSLSLIWGVQLSILDEVNSDINITEYHIRNFP